MSFFNFYTDDKVSIQENHLFESKSTERRVFHYVVID